MSANSGKLLTMSDPITLTDSEELRAALRDATAGMDKQAKFYFMAGVAWAMEEMAEGSFEEPHAIVFEDNRVPFMAGRNAVRNFSLRRA